MRTNLYGDYNQLTASSDNPGGLLKPAGFNGWKVGIGHSDSSIPLSATVLQVIGTAAQQGCKTEAQSLAKHLHPMGTLNCRSHRD